MALTDLDVSASIQEYVITLDITMDNILGMEMLQTLARL